MPSELNSILGLPDLEINQAEVNDFLHVWASPKNRPACIYCSHPKVRIKATYTRVVKHTRLGNRVMFLHPPYVTLVVR